MPLDIVILGPPGAGKGTQAKRLAEDHGIPHVATGDILRAAIAERSELGRRVKGIVERGSLVPDDLVVEVIRERLSQRDTDGGVVFDGFPRTLGQATALDRLLADLDRNLSIVLEFELPDEVAERRLLGRARAEGRADDTPEVIRRRIAGQRVPEELIEYYRRKGILVGIHADRSIDEVYAEVQEAVEQVPRDDRP